MEPGENKYSQHHCLSPRIFCAVSPPVLWKPVLTVKGHPALPPSLASGTLQVLLSPDCWSSVKTLFGFGLPPSFLIFTELSYRLLNEIVSLPSFDLFWAHIMLLSNFMQCIPTQTLFMYQLPKDNFLKSVFMSSDIFNRTVANLALLTLMICFFTELIIVLRMYI